MAIDSQNWTIKDSFYDYFTLWEQESGGVPGRVHISDATFKCLNDAYEVEPGDGGSRDSHLKMLNIKTYLIKRTEPLR